MTDETLAERLRAGAEIGRGFGSCRESRAIADALDEAADRITSLEERVERLNEWCADAQMNGHKWMQAHDKLKAGKPYDLPKPADLPDAIKTLEEEKRVLREAAKTALLTLEVLEIADACCIDVDAVAEQLRTALSAGVRQND